MLNDKVFYACQPWLQSVFEGRVRGGFIILSLDLSSCAYAHAHTRVRARACAYNSN